MGSFHCPEKLSLNRERVVKELVQGKEFANQLQILLQEPYGGQRASFPSRDELIAQILRSFTETISILGSFQFGDELCQNLATSQVDSACCDDRRSEDFGESKKRTVTRDRRGCYKRKKGSYSWTTVSPTTEDGQAWRKYGQKEILNAKYPRSYFRCTRKYDQGCRATKQVQRMEENPQMYQTTYIGHHTCKEILRAPQIITDSDPWDSYYAVCSTSKIRGEQDQRHCATFSATPTIKQESKEEAPSDITDYNSSLDSVVWKDLMPFESPKEPNTRSACGAISTIYSSTEATSQTLDLDFVVNCDFSFDESEVFLG